jgi:hydroxypyruvate isomerase
VKVEPGGSSMGCSGCPQFSKFFIPLTPPLRPCYDCYFHEEETIMNRRETWNRRSVLQVAGAGLLGALATPMAKSDDKTTHPIKGNIKQSVCRWCYSKIGLEDLAAAAMKMGYKSIELLRAHEVKVIKPYGLTCAMLSPDLDNFIPVGLNRKENHARIHKALRNAIEFAAAEGLPNVICMSGNRKGMADDEGLENCVVGLKGIVGFAEEKNITLCMEGLNSKVDHKDYMYDRTKWGVELAKKVGSPRFRLLYDIYHMQIMEGDVIRTIRENKAYLAHFHTGGNPGRHEIDDTQELNYPAVMRAIAETGFQGYVAQEFIPVRDPLASLGQGFRICDV